MEVDIKFDFVTGNQDIQNHHADRTNEFRLLLNLPLNFLFPCFHHVCNFLSYFNIIKQAYMYSKFVVNVRSLNMYCPVPHVHVRFIFNVKMQVNNLCKKVRIARIKG